MEPGPMTIRLSAGLGPAFVRAPTVLLALTLTAAAQSPMNPPPAPVPGSQAANPVCARLEGQLAGINNGNQADNARAAQIKQAEDAVAKQQADLDRAVSDGHK